MILPLRLFRPLRLAFFCFCLLGDKTAQGYVERVAVLEAEPELIDALAWSAGNYYKFESITRSELANGAQLQDAEQVILRIASNSDVKSLVADARKLPHVGLIHLLPNGNVDEVFLDQLISALPEMNAPAQSRQTALARVVLHDPRSPDGAAGPRSLEAAARLSRNAVTIPWAAPILEENLGRFGPKGAIDVRRFVRGSKLLRDAAAGLEIVEPPTPRSGREWFWVAAPSGFEDEALKPWVSLLLHRGYYLIRVENSENLSENSDQIAARAAGLFKRLNKMGLAKVGGALMVGDRMETTLEWAAAAPGAWRQLIVLNPPSTLAGPPGRLEASLVKLISSHKSICFVTERSLTPNAGDWLWRARVVWEQSNCTFVSLVPANDALDFLSKADVILRDGGAMTGLREAYAHRPPTAPAFPRIPAAEMVARFRQSGEGNVLGKLNPRPPRKQDYFAHTFEQTRARWREELGLKRREDGSLEAPTVDLNQAVADSARTVTLNEVIHTLSTLCRAWRGSARTMEDRAQAEPLIRDLGALLAHTLRTNFSTGAMSREMHRNRRKAAATFAAIALSAQLLDPDDSEEMGRFVLDELKDRWSLEPYQNMDVFRSSATILSVLNFFQDDAVLYRHLQERADYVDRIMRLGSGISQEGGPRHHGLMHYSYAAYSFWAIERLINTSNALGNYLSQETYDRYRRVGILGTALTAPRYYGGILPYNVNARTGARLGVGGAGVPALNITVRRGEGDQPEGWNRESLAYLDWLTADNKLVAEARQAQVDWSSIPLRLQRTVNTGTFAIRQFGEVQACAVGMSRHLGSWVEVYFKKSGEGFGLYHKAGSLHLRSPDALCAERFVADQGYDHTRTPGTTSEPRLGPELWLLGGNGKFNNDLGIAGGTHLPPPLNGGPAVDGMLAVDLDRGPAPGCYKSYFFFGSRIISLTSNIERFGQAAKRVRGHAFIPKLSEEHRAGRPILTTLFQWPLDATAEDAAKRNAPGGKQLPIPFLSDVEHSETLDDYVVRRDQFGNAWVLHPTPNAVLHYRRGGQEYQFFSDHQIGRWENSWVEHLKPGGDDAAALIYTLLPRTTAQDPQALVKSLRSNKPAYQVWRCDQVAHILHDFASDAAGYAIFHPTPNPAHDAYLPPGIQPDPNAPCFLLAAQGDLLTASAPAFAIIRRDGENSRTLSYFNPNPKKSRRVILTLRGKWRLEGAWVDSDPDTHCETLVRSDDNTEIHFLAGPKMRNDGNDNRLPVMLHLDRIE